MSSVTRGAPKELLPIAGKPILVRVLEECALSGITDALIVTAPGKEAIEKTIAPLAGKGIPERIDFVVQPSPKGLADAIRLGRDFSAHGPLAVALPDNLFRGDVPALAQVVDLYEMGRMNVVAVVKIDAAEAARRGPTAVYPGEPVGDEYRIAAIPSKGAKTDTFDTLGAAAAYTAVGRFVFEASVFDVIDDVERTLASGQELDDVPVMQSLLRSNAITGRLIRGDFFDVGLIDGFREAAVAFSCD